MRRALLPLALALAPRLALADPGAPDGRDEAILRACGPGDAALARVASALAMGRVKGEPMPPSDEVAMLVRDAGGAQPWPRAVAFMAPSLDRAQLAGRVSSWASKLPNGKRRVCGVGSAENERGDTAVVVLAAPSLGELVALPRKVKPSTWVTVDARLLSPVDIDTARIVVLGPRGEPRSLLTSASKGRITGKFSADRPGRWLVQVLADAGQGPLPALEATIVVGDDDAVDEAPPGDAERGEGDEATVLAMLSKARKSEGAPKLRDDATLTRMARAQAERMARAGSLAHDAGDGTPDERLEREGVSARYVGENVAHASSLRGAHRVLWASPSHRQNLLSPRFESVGVGVARSADGTLWVAQLFAGR